MSDETLDQVVEEYWRSHQVAGAESFSPVKGSVLDPSTVPEATVPDLMDIARSLCLS